MKVILPFALLLLSSGVSRAQQVPEFLDYKEKLRLSEESLNQGSLDTNRFNQYKASLAEDKTNRKVRVHTLPTSTKVQSATARYEENKHKTYVAGLLYKAPDATNWSLYGMATAFAISEDGYLASNQHVVEELDKNPIYKGTANENLPCFFVAIDFDGRVYPVQEISTYNKEADLAIFKINTDGKKISAFSLGEVARVGEEVFVLSHPSQNYYYLSQGIVNKNAGNAKDPMQDRTYISADYSVGSSGGPIFDDKGNIVSVVSQTGTLGVPINGNRDNINVQMILKLTMPVHLLKTLITP